MTESMGQNYYEVLEVSEDATQEEVKAAYKKVMRDYHPDNFRDADKEWIRKTAESRSKAANAAYDTLKNPQKRADYDRNLALVREQAGNEERWAWEEQHRQEEEERAQDPWEAWNAWEAAQEAEEDSSDEQDNWDDWEGEDEAGEGWTEWEEDIPRPSPPTPAMPPPSDLLGLASWTAERIPTPVHLLCGAMLSGFGWTLAFLLVSQQSFLVGSILTLVFLAAIPVAGGLLWFNGFSLSRTGMVLVALGGGLPVLVVVSVIPGLNWLMFLGAVVWAVIMVTDMYARRNAI